MLQIWARNLPLALRQLVPEETLEMGGISSRQTSMGLGTCGWRLDSV